MMGAAECQDTPFLPDDAFRKRGLAQPRPQPESPGAHDTWKWHP